MTSDRRRLLDQVLDLTVFGPLGFALEARRLVPELAQRGRDHVDGYARTARSLGTFATALGRGVVPGSRPPSARPPAAGDDPSAESGSVPEVDIQVSVEPEKTVRAVEDVPGGDSTEAGLPIEGYDALAASQIVARLPGLGPDELDRVRRYEAAHRGRRTVLHRATQLLDG